MSWDKHEAESIAQLIQEHWPQSRPLTDAQLRSLQKRMPGSGRVAMRAIEEVAEAREQTSRPGRGKFIAQALEIVRNTSRAESQKHKECPWCLGRRFVHVNVWQATGEEVTRLGVPENMLLKKRSGLGFVVDPRIAPELGIQETMLTLDCGHCDWHLGRLCIQDFAAFYKHFWRYSSSGDEAVGERCIHAEQPEELALMTLEEFLRCEDVNEETQEMLQRAREG